MQYIKYKQDYIWNYTEKMVCDFGRIEVPTTPDSVCEEHKYIKGMEHLMK